MSSASKASNKVTTADFDILKTNFLGWRNFHGSRGGFQQIGRLNDATAPEHRITSRVSVPPLY